MRKHFIAAGLLASAAFVATTSADDTNIALNEPVSVFAGSAQITNSSTLLSVIDDGTFVPEVTPYGNAVSTSVQWTTTDNGNANDSQ